MKRELLIFGNMYMYVSNLNVSKLQLRFSKMCGNY
eukprot:UN28095